MTDEEIFDLAERHGWMDDFGRWNFKDDGLISFALAMSEKNVRVSDKWVGLTDEEAWKCWDWEDFQGTWKSMEAKLKEKNT